MCLGLPGALPVLVERQAVGLGIEASLALHCTVNPKSIFAAEKLFLSGLAEGLSGISQYDQPLAEHGFVRLKSMA